MNNFSYNLIELRKISGFTQKELAERLGISRSAIGNYEKGIREPDLETLEKIADFFNMDMGQLIGKDNVNKAIYTSHHILENMSEDELQCLRDSRELNEDGKKSLKNYLYFLLSQSEYTIGPKKKISG